MPNYQRILEVGGADGPEAATIVGNEASVTRQLNGSLNAGATDVWAAIVPVGSDRGDSTRRTTELLRTLL
jgi:hypothetical protein